MGSPTLEQQQTVTCQTPVPFCRAAGFLGPSASSDLLQRVLDRGPQQLTPSLVAGIGLDVQNRRSRNGDFDAPELLEAVEATLEPVQQLLGITARGEDFEYYLTAHNDGDFFAAHQDVDPRLSHNAHDPINLRLLTFVYYMHREPKAFTGGQLRLHDVTAQHGTLIEPTTYRDIEPEHDTITFFAPTAWHEILPVTCPSGHYTDSRFAFNGWLRLPPPQTPRKPAGHN
jgi:hypothetical protein